MNYNKSINHNTLTLDELGNLFHFYWIVFQQIHQMTRLDPRLSSIQVNDSNKSCGDASAKFGTRYSINVISSSNARLRCSFFQPTNVWIAFMIRGIPNPVIAFLYVLAFSLAIKCCSNIIHPSCPISFAATDSCIIHKAITTL